MSGVVFIKGFFVIMVKLTLPVYKGICPKQKQNPSSLDHPLFVNRVQFSRTIIFLVPFALSWLGQLQLHNLFHSHLFSIFSII